jgi:hypothetical protein
MSIGDVVMLTARIIGRLVDKEWSRMCEELVADWFLGMG